MYLDKPEIFYMLTFSFISLYYCACNIVFVYNTMERYWVHVNMATVKKSSKICSNAPGVYMIQMEANFPQGLLKAI